MDKTEVLVAIMGVAGAGHGFSPVDALAYLADLIQKEDVGSSSHDANVEKLLRVGACIWILRREMFAPTISRTS